MRIFLIGLLLLVCGVAEATDINWAADAGSTKTGSTTGNGTTAETGSVANCYDENTSTYYMRTSLVGGDGTVVSTLTTRSVFSKPVILTRARVLYDLVAVGYFGSPGSYSWNVKYRVGASWTTVASGSGGAIGNPASPTTLDSDTTGLNVVNVDAIEFNCTTQATGFRNPVFPFFIIPGYAYVTCYELYAYGHVAGGGYAMIY